MNSQLYNVVLQLESVTRQKRYPREEPAFTSADTSASSSGGFYSVENVIMGLDENKKIAFSDLLIKKSVVDMGKRSGGFGASARHLFNLSNVVFSETKEKPAKSKK